MDDATDDPFAVVDEDGDLILEAPLDEDAEIADLYAEDEDSYGEVVGEAVESVEPDPIYPPPPITAHSHASARNDRVLYENEINAGAEQFAIDAKAAYIDAALAGQTVTIVTE